MSNNFSNTYQRTWEWSSEADKIAGGSGNLVSGTSTQNTDIGTDVDGQVLRSTPIPGGSSYREIQTLDYDILNRPQGNNSASVDTSWAQRLESSNNFLTQSNKNVTVDQGGFMDARGGGRTDSDNVYEGTWDQAELENINNGRLHDVGEMVSVNLEMKDSGGFSSDNQHTSIKGLVEHNALNDVFFSDMNTKVLQDTLAFRVYQNTDQYIGNQSKNELFIVMRSILLQFANFRVHTDNLVGEIKKLNEKVLNYCVENVSSNVLQHQGYIDDVKSMPIPLSNPVNPYSDRGYGFDLSRRNRDM
jgi:hypothetical protein